MTAETNIRRLICSYLTLKKGFVWVHDSVGIYDPVRKVFRSNKDPFRIRGVSDILGIWQGKPLAIEVKVKGGYASKEQKAFIERFKEAGGIAFVARSIEDVELGLGIVK